MITFLKALLIGICAVLPGVSGSLIMISLGIYDKLIEIINDHKIKDNKLFLLYLLVGILIGMYSASFLLIYMFKYKAILYYIFIGIILSEVPFIVKKIHIKGRIKLVPLVLSFIFSILLDSLNKQNALSSYSFFRYFIGGILFSFGKVFPGISSSFFLLCLGIYDKIIILVINPFYLFKYLYLYIPFLIGAVLGLIIFLKLLSYLMKKYYEIIYSIILGLLFSSTIILFPSFSFNKENIVGFTLMALIFVIFINNKYKNN